MTDDFLSDEEKSLFRQTVANIKPLKKTGADPFFKEKTEGLATEKKQETFHLKNNSEALYLSDAYKEGVSAESRLAYCIPGFPRKRFFELKNGRISLQAHIDLHGLKPETAKEALIKFILSQTELDHRCLLIIHGKGSHRGEAPILKNLVNHWLRQLPQVLAFHSALGRDGGNGAVYVLLKRQN